MPVFLRCLHRENDTKRSTSFGLFSCCWVDFGCLGAFFWFYLGSLSSCFFKRKANVLKKLSEEYVSKEPNQTCGSKVKSSHWLQEELANAALDKSSAQCEQRGLRIQQEMGQCNYAKKLRTLWAGRLMLSDQVTHAWKKILKKILRFELTKGTSEVFHTWCLNLRNTWKTSVYKHIYIYLFASVLTLSPCLLCRTQFLLVEEPVKRKAKA